MGKTNKASKLMKKQEALRRRWWKGFFVRLMVVGGLMVTYVLVHSWLYYRALVWQGVGVRSEIEVGGGELPVSLSLGEIRIAVIPAETKAGQWSVAETAANYLVGSGELGTGRGNVVIYGHNRRGILADLERVQVGEVGEVIDAAGRSYLFVVTDILIVGVNEVEWLKPTDEPVITIYTCTGILDSQRLVVRGKWL